MTAAQSLLNDSRQREEPPLRNKPETCSPKEKCKTEISVKMLQSGWLTCTNVLLKDLLLCLCEKRNSVCQYNQDQSRAKSTDWSNVTVWKASVVASSVLLVCPLEGEETSINLYACQVSMRGLCICSQEGDDKCNEYFWIYCEARLHRQSMHCYNCHITVKYTGINYQCNNGWQDIHIFMWVISENNKNTRKFVKTSCCFTICFKCNERERERERLLGKSHIQRK